MRAARAPRSTAPPIAIVATGTPGGICAIESSESMPLSAFDSTGTPITGSCVLAAIIPGRCAAPPAPAIITACRVRQPIQRSGTSRRAFGAPKRRFISNGTPSSFSIVRAVTHRFESERRPLRSRPSASLRLAIAWRLRPISEVLTRSTAKHTHWIAFSPGHQLLAATQRDVHVAALRSGRDRRRHGAHRGTRPRRRALLPSLGRISASAHGWTRRRSDASSA